MKPSLVAQSLGFLIDLQRPAFVWGPPGVGKSDVVRQVAAARGLEVADVRAILLDPVDLRGLPHVNGGGFAHWAQPAFLPREGRGVLFLDELSAAPQSVQAACYQLILDRRLGEYELPAGWSVLAAGNRETDRAVVNRMPSALANRLVHIEYEIDADDWTRWALANGMPVELIAFIRFRPALLHQFDPQKKAFPTPRSWAFVGQMLAKGLPAAVEYDLLSGTVGEGAAAELLGYLQVFRQLPSIEAVLLDPAAAPVPSDPAALYAITSGLAAKASMSNFDSVVAYSKRLPPEFSVSMVKLAVGRAPEVQKTRAYQDWAAAMGSVLV